MQELFGEAGEAVSPAIHVRVWGSVGREGFTEPWPILMLTPRTHCRLSGLENRNEFAIILLLPPSPGEVLPNCGPEPAGR